jgi:peroxiredoxin
MPRLAPGDSAPEFELPVRGKESVRLSNALQNGPVVLLTYVFDFSPG